MTTIDRRHEGLPADEPGRGPGLPRCGEASDGRTCRPDRALRRATRRRPALVAAPRGDEQHRQPAAPPRRQHDAVDPLGRRRRARPPAPPRPSSPTAAWPPRPSCSMGSEPVVARVDARPGRLRRGPTARTPTHPGIRGDRCSRRLWHSLEHLGGHTQEIIALTRMQLGDRYVFAWTPSTVEQGA